MTTKPEVIISGFADEGPTSKSAEGQLTMLSSLGLSYYSVRFVDMGNGVKSAMALTKAEIRRLKRLHREFSIQVSSLGSPIGKVKLRDVEDGSNNVYVPFDTYLGRDVERAVSLAAELETRCIRGFSFYHPRGTDPREYLDEAADRLNRIVERCAQADLIFGLEVEANLIGQDGRLLRALQRRVNHPNLYLIFDGGNLASQNFTAARTFAEYAAMKSGIGWMHIKDYCIDPTLEWKGHVDEERLKNFVPADEGDSGHERILQDFRQRLPALTRKLRRQGVHGVFLDLEPHLRGGGQFGGFSGTDGFGVALRALTRLLDYVGIGYRLTSYKDMNR